MRRFYAIFVVLLTVCGIVLATTALRAAEPASEVKAAYAAWDAAFNSNDAKAIAAFYADDALLLPINHEVYRGPAGALQFFTGVLGTGAKGHKLDLIEARGEGNLLYGAAKWSANGKDAAGKDEPWAGVSTLVFKKQADGTLKIAVHTFN
jgi:ketosteroid isomerase-like protein